MIVVFVRRHFSLRARWTSQSMDRAVFNHAWSGASRRSQSRGRSTNRSENVTAILANPRVHRSAGVEPAAHRLSTGRPGNTGWGISGSRDQPPGRAARGAPGAPDTPEATSHRLRGIRVHRTGLRCTRIHRFQTAAIFYPVFYPKRQSSGVELLYLLVTATSCRDRRDSASSFPS